MPNDTKQESAESKVVLNQLKHVEHKLESCFKLIDDRIGRLGSPSEAIAMQFDAMDIRLSSFRTNIHSVHQEVRALREGFDTLTFGLDKVTQLLTKIVEENQA